MSLEGQRAVQVREHNADERERVRSMDRLARETVRASVRDSRLAKQVEQLEGVPVQSISQDIYKVALLKLTEIATTDEAERVYENKETGEVDVRRVPNPRQLQALEILLEHRIAEGALLLKAQELDGNERHPERAQVLVVNSADISRLSEMQRTAAGAQK